MSEIKHSDLDVFEQLHRDNALLRARLEERERTLDQIFKGLARVVRQFEKLSKPRKRRKR